jgi:hypothetical protein
MDGLSNRRQEINEVREVGTQTGLKFDGRCYDKKEVLRKSERNE